MKRILLFLIGIMLSVSMLAETVTVDGINYTYDSSNTAAGATLADDNDITISKVVIPATITVEGVSNPISVKSIGSSAFKGNNSINYVIISEGVTSIGNNSFESCSNLQKMELPSTLTTIGSDAFKDSYDLKHISCLVDLTQSTLVPTNFPSNEMMTLYVPEKNWNSYNENSDWKNKFAGRIYKGEMLEVRIESMTYICASVSNVATLFDGDKNKEEVVIPSSIESGATYKVTGIDRHAFWKASLINLTISENVEVIGPRAFEGCVNLRKINLPATDITIKGSAFYNCSKLKYIICRDENPILIHKDAFTETTKNTATLYIPVGSNSNYASKVGWNFSKRIECDEMIEVNQGGMTYVCLSNNRNLTASLTQGAKISDITIPSTINYNNSDYPMTAIAESAFSGNTSLVNLTLEEGIETIGANAFKGCTGLKKVVLPSTLTGIGDNAFNGCNKLGDIVSKIETPFDIATTVFSNYAASLYVPNGKKTAYLACPGWSSFINNIFEGDRIEVTLDGLTYVYATDEANATLTKSATTVADVSIPSLVPGTEKKVTAIAESAFSGIKSLVNLVISEGIKTIGANAFKGCTGLKKVVLPSTLTGIGDNAFNGCSVLFDIVSKIETPFDIPTTVFPNTAASLYVPEGKKEAYGERTGWSSFTNVFSGDRIEVTSDGLTYVYATGEANATLTKSTTTVADVSIPSLVPGTEKKVTAIAESAFSGIKSLVNLVISEGIKTIGANAFKGCTGLKKVVLPSTLTGIGDNAFNGCSVLFDIVSKIETPFDIPTTVFPNTAASLYVPEGKKEAYGERTGWSSFTNVFSGDRIEVTSDGLTYVYATGEANATLTKSTTTVADVSIPSLVPSTSKKVIAIAESAFSGITSLVNLVIPEGVVTIGANAFKNCSGLKKAVLPSTLKAIGDNSFYGCKSMTEVISGVTANNIFAINDNVFQINDNTSPYKLYDNITVFVPIGTPSGSTVSAYQEKGGWSRFTNYLEGKRDQATVDKMTYVYLTGPKTATLISSTTTEKNVTIPDSVKIDGVKYGVIDIGQNAFKGNTSIERLTISEKVKTIGAYAFQGCTGLKKIEFPSTLTAIGEKAFDGCKSITHVCSKISTSTLFEINNNVFSVYTASLYVPEGTLDTYKAKIGWNNFTNNVYTGYFVDDLTIDYLSYDCLITGSGNAATKTATLTKSTTSTADVVIPDSVPVGSLYYRVTNIRQSAFSGNSKLVNITIPTYVTTIGDNTFNNCNNITNIISKIKTPFVINKDVFSISSATLYVPVGRRDAYKTTDGWSKFLTVYEGLMIEKPVGEMVYQCATGDKTAIMVSTTTTATDVIIPDSFAIDNDFYKVIAINQSVFKGKTSIVNLTLPSKLTQIGDNAFNGCKNIATITCKAIEPPVITDNVFPAYTATLYVPVGSRSKYQNATGWNNFATVFEGEWKEVTLDGMTFVYATGDKTATLTKTTSTEKDVTIRGSFDIDGVTYKVTAIGNSAFKGNTSVVNLKISENIKSIGAYAFQSCSNLKRVELPSTLTDIGDKAFDGCKNLTHVCSKAKSPTDIPENTFSAYTAKLFVPDGTLGSYQARNGWNKFTNVYLGYFVDEVVYESMTFVCLINGEGEKAAKNATLIKSATSTAYVSIPASVKTGDVSYLVTTIGQSAFNNSSKLVNLTLSENINSIEDNAFANCLNISVVTSMIKEPVGFNDNVFSAYTASLYVPEGTRAKYQAAKGWKNFATILEGERNETTTEDGMTYIYATGDKTATLVKAASVDKDFTVRGTFKVGEVTYTVTAIDKSVFKDKKTIVNLKIEENIKSIGANAFQNCVNLEKVEVPSTVTEIGECAFDNCTRLSHIVSRVKSTFPINKNVFAESIYPTAKLYVPTVTSADYKTTAGWENFRHILVGDMKEVTQEDITYYLVQGQNIATLVKASTSAAEVTIPATVKDGEITYNVTDIGAYAFSGIGSLKKLTISEGVKSVGIGAFQNCSNLDKVVLPASLTSIGEFAFDKCNRLTLVRNDAQTPIGISENVFSVYTGKLNVPIGSGGQYRNADGWKLFSTILEGDMLEAEVDGMTYAYVTGPRTATLMKGVTEATDLTIPSTITIGGVEYTVTDIEESAFVNATSIVNLTISGGIKTIGANAFKNCSYLTKVELPASLTSIGSGAFSKCDRLSHVVSFILDPFRINDDVFATIVYNNGTLYVPVKTGDLYKDASGWSNFLSVLEGEMYEVTLEGMTYAYIPNLKIAKLTKGISDAKDVTIPSSISIDGISYQVTDIERSAFYGFNSLVNLTVSEGIKTIGYTAFKNCYNLKTVSLPSSLVSIGDYAFENCKKIAMISCEGEKPIAISNNVFSSSSMDLYVPVGAVSLYQADSNWGQFNIMESTTISIGKSGKASYCGNLSLDFSFSDEIKAYIATGFDEAEGTIWLTRVKDVPAGVPVLIKGVANKTYSVAVTDSKNSFYKNMFKGNTSGEQIKVEETEGNLVNYYLSGDGTFKKVKGYVNLGNNKCYLQLPGVFEPEEVGMDQTVTIKESGKASFAAPVDLDFTNVKGLKAFTATGYDKSTKTIWLTRVMKVQKGEGVLLKGNAKDYEIPSVAVQSSYMNMFVGNTSGEKIRVEEKSADGSLTNYYLNSDGSFVSVKGYVNIGDNKCYLGLPTSMVAASSTRSSEDNYLFEEAEMIKLPIDIKSIGNDGDDTTGIRNLTPTLSEGEGEWYTLQGQRVTKPGKGLYIKNGKKILIK